MSQIKKIKHLPQDSSRTIYKNHLKVYPDNPIDFKYKSNSENSKTKNKDVKAIAIISIHDFQTDDYGIKFKKITSTYVNEGIKNFIFVFNEYSMINSFALGILLQFTSTISSIGGIVIIAEPSAYVKRLLNLLDAKHIILTCDSVEDALRTSNTPVILNNFI